MVTKQQGFTLFELIIIVVIIVLLIATVIPRLMDSHDGVYEFSIERIAEEFASEVGLVKARWEVEGRPSGNNGNSSATVVKHRENQLGVDGTLGFPTGNANDSTLISTVNVEKCKKLFELILPSAPSSTITTNDAEVSNFDYLIREDASGKNTHCVYYVVDTIDLPNRAIPSHGTPDATMFDGFTYNPATGQISIF